MSYRNIVSEKETKRNRERGKVVINGVVELYRNKTREEKRKTMLEKQVIER